jgi:hypothetical protein
LDSIFDVDPIRRTVGRRVGVEVLHKYAVSILRPHRKLHCKPTTRTKRSNRRGRCSLLLLFQILRTLCLRFSELDYCIVSFDKGICLDFLRFGFLLIDRHYFANRLPRKTKWTNRRRLKSNSSFNGGRLKESQVFFTW